MAKITVTGGNQPEKRIKWNLAKGTKTVTTGEGSRVDVYSKGRGRPDGPGHVHEWATYDKNGKRTSHGKRS